MIRTKILAGLAGGLVSFFIVGETQAQFSGPSARINNAYTERQARAACRAEVGPGRGESRRAIAKKTQLCIANKMNGTNR